MVYERYNYKELAATAIAQKNFWFSRKLRKMPTKAAILKHWAEKKTFPHQYACFVCEWDADKNGLERSHILPVCYGGSDDAENLHLLCGDCHKYHEWKIDHAIAYLEWDAA